MMFFRHGIDSFEEQVQRAERAIKDLKSDETAKWFQILLDILKEKKYARIITKGGAFIDVEGIAYTYTYVSFFDIYSKRSFFDITTEPTITTELKNKCYNITK